jgi:hypothetical protein
MLFSNTETKCWELRDIYTLVEQQRQCHFRFRWMPKREWIKSASLLKLRVLYDINTTVNRFCNLKTAVNVTYMCTHARVQFMQKYKVTKCPRLKERVLGIIRKKNIVFNELDASAVWRWEQVTSFYCQLHGLQLQYYILYLCVRACVCVFVTPEVHSLGLLPHYR